MSFLKRLFGSPKPSQIEYVEAMGEMANEAERTYRGMLEIYNAERGTPLLPSSAGAPLATPTGQGLYKARLFGALFMLVAYNSSGHSQEQKLEMTNIATGLALEPLQGSGDVHLSRDEAKSFAMSYLTSTLRSMIAATNAGPLLPGAASREHKALAEHLHNALADSIGSQWYTPEVRERFDITVQGNIAAAMNHARRWVL